MRSHHPNLLRLLLICGLAIFGFTHLCAQQDTSAVKKYKVDKDKKPPPKNSKDDSTTTASTMLLPPPPVDECTLSGTTSVMAGSSYTYYLNCGDGSSAGYWSASCGNLTSYYTTQATVQWNYGCTTGSVTAYDLNGVMLASLSVTISGGTTVLSPGSISNSSQTINYNATPAQLTASAATGGSCGGMYDYQWQKGTSATGPFTDISGAIYQNYQPPALTTTSWYRRKVTCSGSTAYTNIATVNVASVLVGGYVTNPTQLIAYNTTPAQINASGASGGNCSGNYQFQWQKSTDNVNWSDIPGATAQNYQPGPLTVETYFRRKVTCNGEVAYTETNATISIILPLNGGCITDSSQQVLYGNVPSPVNATPAAHGNCNGNYAYQWQRSTDNNYFTDIPGANSQNLSFTSPLAQTTYFQRKTICGSEVAYTGSGSVIMTSTITYYNVAKSGSFTRNNCPSGQTGSTVTYTVLANTYSSTVSQAAADQLAQDDVNANGQAYANANGTCTASGPVTISLENLFIDPGFPPSITVKFKQGGTVVQTNNFPATSTGSASISLPAGTYQLEFVLPAGYSGFFVSFSVDNPYQYWDNGGNSSVVTTGNVVFSYDTSYSITASEAM